jgi:hypothetical protein
MLYFTTILLYVANMLNTIERQRRAFQYHVSLLYPAIPNFSVRLAISVGINDLVVKRTIFIVTRTGVQYWV